MKLGNYKIAVIGAGPAGSSFLRHLSRNLKEDTILIEKEKLPRTNTREAELVEETIEFLNKYYKKIPRYIFSDPKQIDIYYVDFDNNVKVYEKRGLWNINREKFDFWLFKESSRGIGNMITGKVLKIYKVNGSSYGIKINIKNSIKRVEAKYIIGADGPLSITRECLGYTKMKYYFGYQEWIDSSKFSGEYMYFIYDSKVSKYYSWIIPKDNLAVIGTALLPDQKNTISILKEKAKKYLNIHGHTIKKKLDVAIRSSPNRVFLGKDNIFLIGEAAGLISPSTAEGISFALRSGKYCAEAFNNGEGLNEYKRLCQELIEEIKIKYEKLKILQNPKKRIELWNQIGEIEKL